MATLIITYALAEGATFDRDYYLAKHLPLAQSAWEEHGVVAAEVLFPSADSEPFAAVSILRFADQSGIDAAFASPATAEVIGDVANFTNIAPTMFRAAD